MEKVLETTEAWYTSDYVKRSPCMYCEKRLLRIKEDADWKKGEKAGRGYYPEIFEYFYCEGCKQTSVRSKKWQGGE